MKFPSKSAGSLGRIMRAPSARIRSRGAIGWACTWSDELFLLHTETPLERRPCEKAVVGHIHVEAGKKVRFSLCYAKADIGVVAPLGEEADDRLQTTLEWWRAWSSQCAYEGPHREAVIRSAITLKLMTFTLSGAVSRRRRRPCRRQSVRKGTGTIDIAG